jgi:hypothetical protein
MSPDVSTPKAFGAGKPLNAISRFNWSRESAEVEAAFQSASSEWFRALRRTGLQLMQSTIPKEIRPKMTTLPVKNSLNRTPLQHGFLLLALPLALGCFALLPTPKAFGVSPAPDGGYANGNTAEGTNALFSLTSGFGNTANGFAALSSNTTGAANTANGLEALAHNTTGGDNTANGTAALFNNTTGGDNTANGFGALNFNTTGSFNTANGFEALFNNTSGTDNTADGVNALYSNTTGLYNTANGLNALFSNTTGGYNTANGVNALYSNTAGTYNTANGVNSLFSNTTANANTANGYQALLGNTTGPYNTADGVNALKGNTIGGANTANGVNALFSNTSGGDNTANGFEALFNNTTGRSNIALGFQAGLNLTTGSNNIDIYNPGVAGESNIIRIGTTGTQQATFIAGISGIGVTGAAVVVSSSGQLGVAPSSERFKDEIKPMDEASEAILALKPVTFRYKHELDPEGIPQFGLVAEQVEKVNPDLVARDKQGKVFTVRYEAMNAMLLNEFLKEHRKVQKQETSIAQLKATVAQQQKGMEVLAASLKEQASQIRAVNQRLDQTPLLPLQVDNSQ